ncbi:growth factor [Amanita rubescens]|nr:growth factor [Amanita rubescens]
MTAGGDSKDKMPPGMIMGPDGKPCKICTAFRNWKPQTGSNIEPSPGNPLQKKSSKGAATTMAAMFGAAATGSSSSSSSSSQTPSQRPDEPPVGCPPDVEQLGRATWTFLHTTAAYYPDKPTPTQRANMLTLLRALPVLYPCSWCAIDFGEDIKDHPPDVSSRASLSRWLCERHNAVNEKLGKEKFDCSKTDERWKDGPSDGRCD